MPKVITDRTKLTDNEIDALVHAANGRSVEQSAELMNYTPHYVRHIRKMYLMKLEATNSTHAVAIGFARGILVPEDIKCTKSASARP